MRSKTAPKSKFFTTAPRDEIRPHVSSSLMADRLKQATQFAALKPKKSDENRFGTLVGMAIKRAEDRDTRRIERQVKELDARAQKQASANVARMLKGEPA